MATAFDNRGVAYKLKGEYDRALPDYEEAIRLNPNSAKPYNNRGIIYRIKGDYDRAIADYDEARSVRMNLTNFAAVHESAVGPSRHVSTRWLTVAFGANRTWLDLLLV